MYNQPMDNLLQFKPAQSKPDSELVEFFEALLAFHSPYVLILAMLEAATKQSDKEFLQRVVDKL